MTCLYRFSALPAGLSALVTGAGRGLGGSIAARLAAEGWHVVVNDIDADAANQVVEGIAAAGGSARAAVADITDGDAVAALVAGIESGDAPIGAAVLNATGPQSNRPFTETRWNDVVGELEFFVKSPLVVTRRVLAPMTSRCWGRIVHIDSEVASKLPRDRAAYITAKTAQMGLMRATALEVAAKGITVNSVSPGFVPVERHASVSGDERNEYLRTVPAGYLGTGDDVAAAVAFLVSSDARFITGQRLLVDGGRHLT